RAYQLKLTPLTGSRVLHLVTVPPERPMNEDVMRTRRLSLRRRRHLLRNRPDEPRELARDRGRDLRFRLSPRHQTPEAGGQPQLSFPGNVTGDPGQRVLPIRMLAPDT